MENNKKKKYYQYYRNNQSNHNKYYYKKKKKKNININDINTNKIVNINNMEDDNKITKKILTIDDEIDFNEYSGLLKKKDN